MKRTLLDEIQAARRANTPVALVTTLRSGVQTLVFEDSTATTAGLTQDLLQLVADAIGSDRSQSAVTPEGEVFVHVFSPPRRLVVIGAVHIAQALIPMARALGYQVTLVDPRGAFASAERFPDVDIDARWPDEALSALRPDRRTAVVTLTHDPKLDEPALIEALRSDAFYVGSLGSRKTHAGRIKRLVAGGVDSDQLKRIFGPVGLDLGALSPAEIALAIMAQITKVFRKGIGT
ncbi:MAG: XdhC family protein [Gammaproteobacteria bacterium]|nr:XdhC family protein [Gammaproteobacteria bacterium]